MIRKKFGSSQPQTTCAEDAQEYLAGIGNLQAHAREDAANVEAIYRLTIDYRLGREQDALTYFLHWGKRPGEAGASRHPVGVYRYRALQFFLQELFALTPDGSWAKFPARFRGQWRHISWEELKKMLRKKHIFMSDWQLKDFLRDLERLGIISRERQWLPHQKRKLLWIRLNGGKLIAILNEFFPRTRNPRLLLAVPVETFPCENLVLEAPLAEEGSTAENRRFCTTNNTSSEPGVMVAAGSGVAVSGIEEEHGSVPEQRHSASQTKPGPARKLARVDEEEVKVISILRARFPVEQFTKEAFGLIRANMTRLSSATRMTVGRLVDCFESAQPPVYSSLFAFLMRWQEIWRFTQQQIRFSDYSRVVELLQDKRSKEDLERLPLAQRKLALRIGLECSTGPDSPYCDGTLPSLKGEWLLQHRLPEALQAIVDLEVRPDVDRLLELLAGLQLARQHGGQLAVSYLLEHQSEELEALLWANPMRYYQVKDAMPLAEWLGFTPLVKHELKVACARQYEHCLKIKAIGESWGLNIQS